MILLLGSFVAHSFVEFHSHYGSINSSPSKFNNGYYNFQDAPKLEKQTFLGFDAIARFGAFPLRIGLRYESIGEEHTKYNKKVQLTASRFSGVLNYRMINSKIYLGLIGTYGFSHHLQIDLPNDVETFDTSSGNSKSLGLEGGVKFGPLRLGGEIGQLYLNFAKLKNKAGLTPVQNGIQIDEVDLSAPYYKIIIGVGF